MESKSVLYYSGGKFIGRFSLLENLIKVIIVIIFIAFEALDKKPFEKRERCIGMEINLVHRTQLTLIHPIEYLHAAILFFLSLCLAVSSYFTIRGIKDVRRKRVILFQILYKAIYRIITTTLYGGFASRELQSVIKSTSQLKEFTQFTK